MRYITHEEAGVRANVIYALRYRTDIPHSDDVIACLDDKSVDVRVAALYYFQGSENPQVLAKIRDLTHDPDDRVRESAYRALRLTLSTFYRFLAVSFLDRSKRVRGAADHLSLLWERKYLAVSLMLLWPGMIVAGIAVKASRGRRLLMVVTGIAAGYIAGLAAGYLTGRFYVGNPLFNAIILVPPFFMPFALGLSGVVNRFGRKIPLAVFPLVAAGVCLALGLVTWNNTLWPCVLAGFVVLELFILLLPYTPRQSTKSAEF